MAGGFCHRYGGGRDRSSFPQNSAFRILRERLSAVTRFHHSSRLGRTSRADRTAIRDSEGAPGCRHKARPRSLHPQVRRPAPFEATARLPSHPAPRPLLGVPSPAAGPDPPPRHGVPPPSPGSSERRAGGERPRLSVPPCGGPGPSPREAPSAPTPAAGRGTGPALTCGCRREDAASLRRRSPRWQAAAVRR